MKKNRSRRLFSRKLIGAGTDDKIFLKIYFQFGNEGRKNKSSGERADGSLSLIHLKSFYSSKEVNFLSEISLFHHLDSSSFRLKLQLRLIPQLLQGKVRKFSPGNDEDYTTVFNFFPLTTFHSSNPFSFNSFT